MENFKRIKLGKDYMNEIVWRQSGEEQQEDFAW